MTIDNRKAMFISPDDCTFERHVSEFFLFKKKSEIKTKFLFCYVCVFS